MLSKKSKSSLTTAEKEIFTKYLILTWNRPTEAREHMKESFEKGIIEAIKMNPDLKLPENVKPVMNEDYLRFQHESQIFRFLDENSDVYLVDRILNFKWMLIEAKNQNFILVYEKQKSKGNEFIADIREKALTKLKNG